MVTVDALRLPRHRSTTAHVCSAYPFVADDTLGAQGVYLGTDVLAGGSGFAYDPFHAYAQGLLTNPNILIAGEPGTGKSATAKAFVYRSVGVFGRWVAIADPKGEYLPLADALDLSLIKLHPGGTTRINPLDPGPAATSIDVEERARRQTEMVAALLGTVLRRDLTPAEDAVLGWSISHIARSRVDEPVLADVAAVMASPTDEMATAARADAASLARSADAAIYGIGKLLERSLRGMFDGRTNVRVDWDGPGIVLDLSAVHHDPDALTLVMIAATSWLQTVMARSDGPRRLQVLDEAWTLLGSERTSKYLQACWKLSRAYGVANLAIVHRLSDLRAQSDDGTTAAKVSMGLLADTQTRVLFRQSTDQVREARELLGLTETEAALLPHLAKGRALWKIAGHTAVVEHVIAPRELELCNTDARMRAT